MSIGRLHVLTNFHLQQQYSHAELAELAIDGGASTIQFRQKHGLIREKLHEARRVYRVCHRHGTPLIVDDHIDIALSVNASGIHLGQEDFPVLEAKQLLGFAMAVGATVTNREQAEQAVADGADYLGFGPVFSGQSKANPSSVKGLRGLELTSMAVDVPVIAIGGITADSVRSVLEAGAHGVAVMSAVCMAPDPAAATKDIRREIDRFFG